MSVQKLPGTRGYLVRWRDSAGASRSKTVLRQRDAFALDGEMKRRKSLGSLIEHERGDETLTDFWKLFWDNYAVPNTTPRTRDTYDRLWRIHIEPALGNRKLKSITTEQVSALVGKLGKTLAPATVGKVLALLRNVLQRAVEWRYITDNPATHVRRPKANSRRGRALTELELNKLCLELPPRSEDLVRVLAQTGLRPGELRALRWGDMTLAGISVTRAASSDQIGPTKTGKTRCVEYRDGARYVLRRRYMLLGQPAADALVFPGRNGKLWQDSAYNTWSTRTFAPAAARAGLAGVVPYDLRHTFVSTLIDEGRNLEWIARQAGHSLGVLCATYAHLLGAEPVASERHANRSVLDNLRASSGS